MFLVLLETPAALLSLRPEVNIKTDSQRCQERVIPC